MLCVVQYKIIRPLYVCILYLILYSDRELAMVSKQIKMLLLSSLVTQI